MRRVLILDAYDRAGRAGLERAGARFAGELYAELFEACAPLTGLSPQCDIVRFDEVQPGRFELPAALSAYDAMVWTGANLTVHADSPAVRAQLELAEAGMAAGIPAFGSCWALQLIVTVDGGRCEANPRGREFGVARKIRLTDEGRTHPMFAGRASGFDGFTSHEDHAVELGPSTRRLAGNTFSPVQAVEVVRHGTPFWAVQYHPEYALADVARLMVARGPQLIEQGFLPGPEAVESFVADYEALHADPTRKDLSYRLGIDEDLLRLELRAAEFIAWVKTHGRA